MKKEGKNIELDLSGLESVPWWNRGVIETFLQNVSEDLKIPENESIIIIGTKPQFERFYQILKRIEFSRDNSLNF